MDTLTLSTLITSDSALAILSSMHSGEIVKVYNGRGKIVGEGAITQCYNSGIRIRLTEAWAEKWSLDSITFFYGGGLKVSTHRYYRKETL